jgi:protein-tyrosine phosphatase
LKSHEASGASAPRIRILFVCLGNYCRSPTAEGVFRQLVKAEAPGLPVDIDSAGTADYHVDSAPDPRSQRAARRRGIDLSGLRGRQISARDFAESDFILAMDRDNLRDLQALAPPNSRARLQLFMEYAPEAGRSEVPDPYCGDAAVFEEVLDLTTAAARGLLAALLQRP